MKIIENCDFLDEHTCHWPAQSKVRYRCRIRDAVYNLSPSGVSTYDSAGPITYKYMKFLSYGVMVYMLLALIWWTVLLSRNNDTLYLKNRLLLEYTSVDKGGVPDPRDIGRVEDEFHRNRLMIWGEGLVFGLSLVAGIWFIMRAYNREVRQSVKEKNFLLSVTHELKSPIASIRLLSETMMKRTLSQEKSREMMEGILEESDRLGQLVDNLLFASRINSEYSYHFERVDIGRLLGDISDRFTSRYPEAVIRFTTPEQPVFAMVDTMAFQSMGANLIENAIKYSPGRPEIDIVLTASPREVRIDVRDKGVGIPENEMQRIFTQFYRIGNEETRNTKGTGLGLFIVHSIITAHKGKIKVSQNQPKGSVFSLTLPLNQDMA